MEPNSLAQIARGILAPDGVVSVRPDLPHLFVGPDVLIGSEGRLLAVFMPKVSERRSPDNLLVRLAISRLALPSHTQCLLLLDGDVTDQTKDDFGLHFHIIEEARRAREALQHMLDLDDQPQLQGRLKELQSRAFLRSEILYRESQKWLGGESPHNRDTTMSGFLRMQYFEQAHIPSWRPREGLDRGTRSNRIYRTNQVILGDASRTDRPHIKYLEPFFRACIKIQYRLDNGILYPFDETLNVLVVSEFPRYGRDPLKPIRAAAFAGWTILPSYHMDRFEEVVESLNSSLGNGH